RVEVLRWRVLEHEHEAIMEEAHGGIIGGHYAEDATVRKILMDGLWWDILYKNTKEYVKACDHCQCHGELGTRDEMHLRPIASAEPFEKWVIDFVGPISQPTHKNGMSYIITGTNYLTHWVEVIK
ncbi:hypothetical protein KI387_032254, partial [Taxus chinensis]